MKKMIIAAALAAASAFTSYAGVVLSFSEIEYWVGAGSKQAGFVIDFHDGTSEQ